MDKNFKGGYKGAKEEAAHISRAEMSDRLKTAYHRVNQMVQDGNGDDWTCDYYQGRFHGFRDYMRNSK